MKKNLLFSALLLMLTQPSLAQEGSLTSVVTDAPASGVDWQAGLIRARGIGYVSSSSGSAGRDRTVAMSAARALAYSQLARIVADLPIINQTTVQIYADTISGDKRLISAVISGARTGAPVYRSDGGVEIELTLTLFGPKSVAQGLNYGTMIQTQLPQSAPAAEAHAPSAEAYTGLIIDARGLGAVPALAPFINSPAGPLYPSQALNLDASLLSQKGLVSYSSSLEAAQTHSRAGQNPLVIKAHQAQGSPLASNLLIEASALEQIQTANARSHFLEALQVVLVL